MPVTISGSTGLAGVDGSAGTPALQGTDTNTGIAFPAADTVSVATGGTERMRVDSSGNVGIGTSSAIRRLTISQSGPVEMVLQDSSQGTDLKNWRVFNSSQSFIVGTLNDAGTAGTDGVVIDRSANLKFNSGYGSVATAYGCRAWVNFNGTGTVAIRASGNVTSITDNGTGDYTVNITTAMPDANYGVALSAQYSTVSTNGRCLMMNASPTTSAIRVGFINAADNALLDPVIYCVSVFR